MRDQELTAFETVAADGTPLAASYADFRDYRNKLKPFSGLAAANPALVNIGDADDAARAWGELVSGNYFDVLGVSPALGRFFLREEQGDKPGAYPVAILGVAVCGSGNSRAIRRQSGRLCW